MCVYSGKYIAKCLHIIYVAMHLYCNLKISNDSTISNSLETAEVLNSFQSTFTLENSDKVLSRSDVCLTHITVTEETVFENFSSLNHLKHLVQVEFILIPLRNVQAVYVGHCVCCSTNHSNLISYPRTGSVLILFLKPTIIPTNKSHFTNY